MRQVSELETDLNNDLSPLEINDKIKSLNTFIDSINKVWTLLSSADKKEFVNTFIKKISVLNNNGTYELNIEFD